MRKGVCSTCGTEDDIAKMFSVENVFNCSVCTEKAATLEPRPRILRILDPTICANCSTDWGNTELQTVGGLPCCSQCRDKFYNYPFPKWLRASLALSLVLLALALAHGWNYFRLGSQLFRGERLINAKQYKEAAVSLKTVVDYAPDCEKCILLLAKAYFLDGNPDAGYKTLMKHNNGYFEERTELSGEVKGIADRVAGALALTETIDNQLRSEQPDQALQSLKQARQKYPEWKALNGGEIPISIAIAFKKQEWDQFLSLAEESFREDPTSSEAAAQVASALAAKYAATGDRRFRERSEEMLAKAKTLAITIDNITAFTEYSERIQHRLTTREIIDKDEYDRRYRASQKIAKAN